jgi:hypothetical protein
METLRKAFEKMGFPVKINPNNVPRLVRSGNYSIIVTKDHNGKEQFLIGLSQGTEMVVLDKQLNERALLVLVNDHNQPKNDRKEAKFLLGHDERQLFVAAVPKASKSVTEAKQGLKPPLIVQAEQQAGVKKSKLHKHKNQARIRQGDFFFLPQPNMQVPDHLVRKNEPISRGRGRTHNLEFCYREGGQLVWVSHTLVHPARLTESEHRQLLKDNPEAKDWHWVTRTRGAQVWAKGKVTHKEHATIVLNCWHLVLINTESQHAGFRGMAFLD